MVLEGRADMDDLESRVAQLLEHLIVDDLFDAHDPNGRAVRAFPPPI